MRDKSGSNDPGFALLVRATKRNLLAPGKRLAF
jgi:hypothetical protein